MSLFNSSVTVFLLLVLCIVLPSFFPTALVIGFSVTLGSFLVVLQTLLILMDSREGGGDQAPESTSV